MKIFTMAMFLLMAPSLVNADDKDQRRQVERLLEVMKVEQAIDSMYSQIDQMFVGMAKELGVKQSEQPIFDRYMQKVAAAMKEEMTWQKMKEPMIDVYMKHYSKAEINDMLAFYSSDSGRSIIAKMPSVMQDSMQISQAMFREFMPRLKQLSTELREELAQSRNSR